MGEPLLVPPFPLWWLPFVVMLLLVFGPYLAGTGGLQGEGQHGEWSWPPLKTIFQRRWTFISMRAGYFSAHLTDPQNPVMTVLIVPSPTGEALRSRGKV